MAVGFTVQYDNLPGLARPSLRLWHGGANLVDLALTGGDEFGPRWELSLVPPAGPPAVPLPGPAPARL